ncbi:amino acid transporter [Lophiostoma macrostomum CBS 122681]|uniref:Amino acid transporter n=1 Tax=Lophiostoma macrostomum CBS 122681 TaxID=1314788 RepID=A0A6A6SLI1_9PLEO|nr:amino acid transporter [Lophiostoma macrostomum CBS 122681]
MDAVREAVSPIRSGEEQDVRKTGDGESEPLLGSRTPDSHENAQQLTTRHAFAILVSLQIGSGIFASPAQVDSNVPSPGAALLVWVLGGLLSWAGAASFAELGAALPLNGGSQEYLRYVYGDSVAFLMSWIYIVGVKPCSMAIQSIVIAESIGAVSFTPPVATWILKLIAVSAFVVLVLLNSINTKLTMRLSESFTVFKITTVVLIVIGGLIAIISFYVDPNSSLSGADDWHTKNWFQTRPTFSGGRTVDWTSMGAWERYGHYSAAIYAGLWAYDGWDSANVVASEVVDPGRSLPRAIKAAMAVVLSSYEFVNIAYYILLPWDTMSTSNAVAVAAAKSLFGQSAGIIVTLLVAISCAGSITGNVFTGGRLIVAASQRHYLPAFLTRRGLFFSRKRPETVQDDAASPPTETGIMAIKFDAPIFANVLQLVVTLVYILTGSFGALITFVGMAEWLAYVSTVVGLLILRRREPELHRPYRPTTALPVTFIVVGSLIIARSAIFAPIPSGVLAGLILVGAVVSKIKGDAAPE